MPVALLPASAAPVTAPLAAPATAPITTSRTTFFALLITPGDERFLLGFLLALFLAARKDPDFLAADFLLAFFDGNVLLLLSDSTRYSYWTIGHLFINITGQIGHTISRSKLQSA
jgi:hypothetical protein